MEPSFWSWEKFFAWSTVLTMSWSRNGAQLLELGKGYVNDPVWSHQEVAMEPSFWSWEKWAAVEGCGKVLLSQWSPAFGAGKSWTPL